MNDEKIIHKLNPIAFAWLKNGIYALAIAGIYSIILVILRTPQLTHLIENKELFKSALIVHVNLSVLVWLMSIIALFWSYGVKSFIFEAAFSKIAFSGLVLISIAPFVGESTPIMNNYIPMLENLSFIVGLSLFGVAILFFALTTIFTSLFDIRSPVIAISSLGIFKITSAGMYILAWCSFIISHFQLEQVIQFVPIELDLYYELLYWSGGHLLQFIYTQGLMMALIVLCEACTSHKLSLNKVYKILFILNFILVLPIFIGHSKFDIIDSAFKDYYTNHMIYAGGIIPAIFIITIIYDYFLSKTTSTSIIAISSALSSLLLFISGGVIGISIAGINVTIPAHYHGSVVGISVAFMGIAYLYCYHNNILSNAETNGFISIILEKQPIYHTLKVNSLNKARNSEKTALIQLFIFTIGQIIHISGLALAGGYGIMRKNPNDIIPLSAKIYMGMVGGGGLLAIIGGLMFVLICVRKIK